MQSVPCQLSNKKARDEITLTEAQAIELIIYVGGGVGDNLRELGAVHAVKWLFASLLVLEMRVLVSESPEETKKLVDAFPVALNLDRPGSCLFEGFVVLVEDLLLDLARGLTEKTIARIVETGMEFGPEAATSAIERT